jgi:hypothetical protein
MNFRLLFFIIGFLTPAPLFSAGPDSNAVPFLLTAAYANDDFFVENEINDLLRSDLFPANDDFVSTSVSVNLRTRLLDRSISADLYYYVLTDRWSVYRSDLMMLTTGMSVHWGGLSGTFGAGVSIGGSLGGTSIQNGYHRLFGYQRVDLPYRKGYEYGGLVLMKFTAPLMVNGGNVLESNFRLQPVIGTAMPGHAEVGVGWRAMKGAFQWETIAAYRHRFAVAPEYRRIFGSSFYTGARAGYAFTASFLGAVWMTKNQYGVQNDLQFGIQLSYRCNDAPLPSLTEMMAL